MTDDDKALVERLREEADTWDEPKSRDDFDMRGLLHGAADEIERLRERIERLRKALYAAYDEEPGWCDLTRAALGETE